MAHSRLFVVLIATAALSSPITYAAATIQIVTPADQAFVNSGGGSPAPVEVTYFVTGNTCTQLFRRGFDVKAYVNGTQVLCNGCGCDGTTQDCNNFTKTILLDGNRFGSCGFSRHAEPSWPAS
jgi:hypothetical protein